MITANLTAAAVIEGFTVKDGNANVSSSITYQSETFYREHGGGMLNASSFPTITNATFVNNSADYGGGMYNASSSPTITNATFEYNKTNSQGGGMYNISSAPVIINTIFSNNRTAAAGGGMYNLSSSPTITNATFEDNSSGTPGGGMRNSSSSSPTITNTIFWNNKKGGSNNVLGADIENSTSSPTVTYCLTQENSIYSSGTGIINHQDPLFVNAANGDYRLNRCSPAINVGTTVTHTADILGNTHVGVVDMGAYEYQGTPYTNAIYVNVNAVGGNNDGSTWTDAYTDLQDAIDNQCVGLDIWVAAGTYLPTKDHTGNSSPSNNRDKTFHLGTDMKIYGGFDGTETLLSQRNAATNITILSGDFNDDDVVTGGGSTLSFSGNTENAFHVMITANLTMAAVIDGFTVKGGNTTTTAAGTFSYQSQTFYKNSGGGILNSSSSPTIANMIFIENYGQYGGGMDNDFISSPTITNTTFTNNQATSGGGMYNYSSSSPTITNTTFTNNQASYGGGMINASSSPTITNTTFTNNQATSVGGGMINDSSSPTITNTTFTNNQASDGGGMYNYSLLLTHDYE